jgi:hypothetical protein
VTAKLLTLFDKGNVMALFSQVLGSRHSCRATAYYKHSLGLGCRLKLSFMLTAKLRIDTAGRVSGKKHPVYALHAADTGKDILFLARPCLVGPIRVGDKRPAYTYKIGLSFF